MGWWTEYASRNSSICGQNFFLKITVFGDGGSTKLTLRLVRLFNELLNRRTITVALIELGDHRMTIWLRIIGTSGHLCARWAPSRQARASAFSASLQWNMTQVPDPVSNYHSHRSFAWLQVEGNINIDFVSTRGWRTLFLLDLIHCHLCAFTHTQHQNAFDFII